MNKINHKVLLIAALTFGLILLLLVGLARIILLADFNHLETRLCCQNMHRILFTIDSDAKDLARAIGDWCAWNDSLDFIRGENSDYVADNLTPDTMANLDLSLIMFADKSLRIHWSGLYDSESQMIIPVHPQLIQHICALSVLWDHPAPESRKAGVIHTPLGLMLAASGPIVNSDNQGPIGGIMVMARRIDAATAQSLSRRMQLPLAIIPRRHEASKRIDQRRQMNHINHGVIDITPIDGGHLQGTVTVGDLAGHAAMEIQTRFAREIYAQGKQTIHYFLLWLGGCAVLVTGIALLQLRRIVLVPIARLNRQIGAIADSSSFSQRLDVFSNDEIGELSRSMNLMLVALDRANGELVNAYDQLKKTQAQLVQSAKLASIGELAAGVAHELNQPLMVIRGTGQLMSRGLAKGCLEPEILKDNLEMIGRNTKRMMNIIDHLRRFSRQSSGKSEPVDVNKTIQDCFLLIGEQLRLREIEVTMELDGALPLVWADQYQLEQVVLNLIANARDAMLDEDMEKGKRPPGRLSLSTRAITDNSMAVEIRIADNGGGISKDNIEKIFDPFFTTKEVGKGTGLGLSISYGIIENHGGELRVHETSAAGTTIVVRVPSVSARTAGTDPEPLPVETYYNRGEHNAAPDSCRR
jgi:signal transduction histidine kinase